MSKVNKQCVDLTDKEPKLEYSGHYEDWGDCGEEGWYDKETGKHYIVQWTRERHFETAKESE